MTLNHSIRDASANEVDLVARARHDAAELRPSSLGQYAETLDQVSAPRIPGYAIVREIHQGGQGVVYQAVQETTGQTVAIKLLRACFESPAHQARFEREIEILAEFQHPHIVAIRDTGVSGGRRYIVMDFVDGQPIDRFVAQTRPERSDLLNLFASVCDTVNAAHLRGVIHRDLKPGNILVRAEGFLPHQTSQRNSGAKRPPAQPGGPQPTVLDFGLAKLVSDDSDATAITQERQFLGSLPWASPEQAAGDHARIDLRTDVYSLGVVLYQLLTGSFPHDLTGTFREVADRIIRDEPTRPSRVAKVVDDELENITLTCLAKDPSRRYQTAGDLAADIRRFLTGQPIAAKRDSALYVLRKALWRYRAPVAVAAAFVLLLAGSAISTTLFWQRAEREARAARAFAQFMEDTLDGVTPSLARGRDTAVLKEMLDAAAKRILNGAYAEQPEIELRMRLAIGNLYRNLVEYAAAIAILEPAEALARGAYGAESVQVADAINGLANVLHNEGRCEESLEKYQASLALCERLKLGDHGTHLEAHRGVLISLRDLGRIEDGFPLTQPVLAMSRRIYGNDHLIVAELLDNRGYFLQRLHSPEAALPLYEDAYAMSLRLLGEDRPHPEFVKCLMSLARCHNWLGHPEKAMPCYEKALVFCRQLYPGPHRETAHILHELGELLRRAGRLEEAEAHAREAVISCREHPEWGSFDVRLNSEFWLARVLVDAGRPGEAVASLRECVAILERQFPKDVFMNLASLHILSWALLELGEVQAAREAEIHMRRSLPLCEERIPEGSPYHWIRYDAMRLLGSALGAQGRFAEAERQLLAAYDGFGRKDYTLPRVEHIGVDFERDTAERLARLYERWHAAQPDAGHDVQANVWKQKTSNTPFRPAGAAP